MLGHLESKMSQDETKMSQDEAKMNQDEAKMTILRPLGSNVAAKMNQKASNMNLASHKNGKREKSMKLDALVDAVCMY